MNTLRSGWLVVKRYGEIARDPTPPLTSDAVTHFYRGFDGVAWPIDDGAPQLSQGLARPELYSAVATYRASIRQDATVDVIFLAWDAHPSKQSRVGGKEVELCGYDFGNFVDESNYFSVILNEVIYGVHDELRAFVSGLNGALLLPSLERLDELRSVRERLSLTGRSLETQIEGEEFEPIAIFAAAED